MAFYTRVNTSTGMIELSMNWFDEVGSPPSADLPIATGSPPAFKWLPDTPVSPSDYETVTRVEPVAVDATEISYLVEDISVAEAKVICKHTVDILRTQKIQIPVVYNTNNYDSDPTSIANLTATVAIINSGASLPVGFIWRDADNNEISLDAAGVKALAEVMFTRVNDCYQASWVHKNAIDALTTTAQIKAYDITTGWPV